MASRKDNKGRVLKTGESQRSNGGYEYRFYDAKKVRHSIYAVTLTELRKKEAELQKYYANGTNYFEGSVTVAELVKRYLEAKSGLSYNTQRCYSYVQQRIDNSPIGQMKIRDVKVSDAKRWFSALNKSGLSYWSISQIKAVLTPAFDFALDDEILNRNPFSFPLSSVISTETNKREALTFQQQRELLKFFEANPAYRPRYEMMVIMIGTGLRVGEIAGLTFNDVDMKKRKIDVNHQLLYNFKRGLFVTTPKTASGNRTIPMSDEVYRCFKTVIQNRRFVANEPVVDGYSGFIFLTKRGTPDHGALIAAALSKAIKEHNQNSPNPLPKVTPHVLRHTFCTNMINSGASVKQVQYLMGHATATVTMNVYAHAMQDQTDDGLIETMNALSLKHT